MELQRDSDSQVGADPDKTVQPGALTALVAQLARAPTHAAPPLLMPGTRTGRYEIIRMIGHGGFGTVYEAHDSALNRLVALKVLSGPVEAAPGSATEGEAAARLAHPNIAALHDAGAMDGGVAYLVYEILHGETLESRLARGPIPPREAVEIALRVARALWHAHTHGVVHRDLKPANVFLTVEGDVKVLDFGMALLFGRAALAGGTPEYMAPEQRRGAPEDARTDLHALGALLREMLTGERGDSAAWRDRVPALVTPVLGALLAEDPASRPRSAQVAVARLELAARQLAAPAGWRRARETLRSRRGRWVVGGTAGILAAVVAGWQLQRHALAERAPLADARFLQLTDFDGIEQAATISRDGRFVAFQSARDGAMDVWVTQVASGQFFNLTRGSAPEIANPNLRALGFSPDGELVTFWGRQPLAAKGPDISVWAVPLLGGPPRPYLEGIAEYDWTSDGGRLVYHTPGPGDPMFVSDSGRLSDARAIFSAPAGLHGHFQLWSPDGSFIYFVQGSLPDRMDIWRIRPTGGPPERVTHHDAQVTYPIFLDARTLLYLATDPDGFGPWIYSLDVERPAPRRVSFGVERYTSLAASGDGRRIVATRANPSSTFWRVPLVGGRADMSAARRIPLTTANGSRPRLGPGYLLYVAAKGAADSLWKLQGDEATEIWSGPDARIIGAPAVRRDGARIAFSVRQGGRTLLYAVNPDGTDARVVTRALELRGAPAWAPDGRSITVAGVVEGAPRLFKVGLDGRSPERFVSEHALDPAWSPDGDVVLFSGPDVGTAFTVKAVKADGSPSAIPVMKLTRGARHLAFAPDGKTLVVLRGDLRHKDLWEIGLDSGAERRVTDLGATFDVRDFDVAPDGREVVIEQVQDRSDVVLIELPRP